MRRTRHEESPAGQVPAASSPPARPATGRAAAVPAAARRHWKLAAATAP